MTRTSGFRLAIVNDTNFGATGRNPGLPDPSDFIIVRVPELHRDREDTAAVGHPLWPSLLGCDKPFVG